MLSVNPWTLLLAVLILLVQPVGALTIKDYHEKLDNQGKGAFIAGYIDGMRDALEAKKDQHGNLKTVETISENLELLNDRKTSGLDS